MGSFREWFRPILVLALGLGILVAGIKFYLLKRNASVSLGAASHELMKKSDSKETSAQTTVHDPADVGAMAPKNEKNSSLNMKLQFPLKTEDKEITQKVPQESSQDAVNEALNEALNDKRDSNHKKNKGGRHLAHDQGDSRSLRDLRQGFVADGDGEAKWFRSKPRQECSSVEYRGYGFQETKVSEADWSRVIDLFHLAKMKLMKWIKSNRRKISEKSFNFMENQNKNLKILRPPSIEEPDLTWRGIGVWTRDDSGGAAIRLSNGFVKLALRQPKRATFELVRLVAQGWAPCELERVGAESPWSPLLSCLEIHDDQGCSAGAYSEGGWAVSSSLAVSLAPPGCRLEAFQDSKKKKCLNWLIRSFGSSKEKNKPSQKGAGSHL